MSKGGKIYSQIWNHFQMLPCKTRARCYHCQKTITCFRHGTSNCKRHLARKHPNFYNGKEYIKFNPMEEETLDDNDADDDGGNYEASINTEEEYAITEVQFVDCPTSTRPKNKDIQEEKATSSKNDISRALKRLQDSVAKEELDTDCREGKPEQVNDSYLRGLIGETDMSMQGTLYATNVAMQLDNLPELQRIIAEKLISDIIYNAKLESLTDEAVVVVRVGTFENDSGELN